MRSDICNLLPWALGDFCCGGGSRFSPPSSSSPSLPPDDVMDDHGGDRATCGLVRGLKRQSAAATGALAIVCAPGSGGTCSPLTTHPSTHPPIPLPTPLPTHPPILPQCSQEEQPNHCAQLCSGSAGRWVWDSHKLFLEANKQVCSKDFDYAQNKHPNPTTETHGWTLGSIPRLEATFLNALG